METTRLFQYRRKKYGEEISSIRDSSWSTRETELDFKKIMCKYISSCDRSNSLFSFLFAIMLSQERIVKNLTDSSADKLHVLETSSAIISCGGEDDWTEDLCRV